VIDNPNKKRNLVITLVLLLAIVSLGFFGNTPVLSQGLATITPQSQTVTGNPGDTLIYNFTLANNASTDTFIISVSSTNLPTGYNIVIPSTSITVGGGGTASFQVLVYVPQGRPAETFPLVLRADAGSNLTASAVFIVNVTGPTVTPTPTNITPTATVGPTATPRPICQDGQARIDPGEDMAGAHLILVDVLEQHGICRIGDIDWFKFGAVGGKVYTIDVPRMDNGLDLSIELYDSEGRLLTSNDDYFNRPASTPGAGPHDIRPQIDSWRAPVDGMYYFRVRDTLNLGGGDRTYDIIVRSESHGPTPITVPEVCADIFEPDGLPENATLIGPNEIQVDHRLCPAGDADWVRFFGKAGKTYYLFTDTRPYNRDNIGNRDPINPQSQAGADTVLFLADRDGVTILDFNDDIPGSLDSEIRFVPTVDGFYYAQIKNTGDYGNQFIRYDFSLKLCVPNEECGRSPVAPAPTPQPTQFVVATPTTDPVDAETQQAFSTQTAVAQQTSQAATEEAMFLQQDIAQGQLLNGPIQGFADPSFNQVWQRTDRPVAEQRVSRSWTWGPRGLMARTESYQQTPGGLRQVQYFDKGRMEVNDPFASRANNWFVTTGLLVIEMITGRMQLGDNEFVQHLPADSPIAGDPNDANAPSYASFARAITQRAENRVGQYPSETINRTGQIGIYSGPVRPETRIAAYIEESGHNIPQVFWDYLNTQGTIYDQGSYRTGNLYDWVFTLGYPISEPYWATVKVGGVDRDVLILPFQRRVLTYSPDNPEGWQVEMGNVGRHYYRWRYSEELPN
jgi:hypothetical protein